MTAHNRLAALQRALTRMARMRALLWGAAVLVAGIVASITADGIFPLAVATRMLDLVAAAGIALITVAILLHRDRGVHSSREVALWIEARTPSLEFALVSLIDATADTSAMLEEQLAAVDWRPAVDSAWGKALRVPALVLAVGLALFAVMPGGNRTRSVTPRSGDLAARVALLGSNSGLREMVATVTTPAYTGLAARVIERPTTIAALIGSTIRLEGHGSAAGLTATLNNAPLDIARDAGRWAATLQMPATATAVRVMDSSDHRLVVLEPITDSVPSVVLAKPAGDTVFRTASGIIAVNATARDDIGLVATWLELVISTGDGDNFKAHTLVLNRQLVTGRGPLQMMASLQLDTMHLHAGDVLHLRALASDHADRNPATPGSSETRTIRIARASEADSMLALALPPTAGDSSLLSERMLIIVAEALVAHRTAISRDRYTDSATRIGATQSRLRKQLADIIFARLGQTAPGEESSGTDGSASGKMTPDQLLAAAEAATRASIGGVVDFGTDESPVVATNRPLLAAYNAMWDASRALDIGDAVTALPAMRRALAAIEEARRAERLYLRGKPPTVVIDLAQVRLAGNRSGASTSVRAPHPADSLSRWLLARFERAIAGLSHATQAANRGSVDSLQLLRVDAIAPRPDFAAQLAIVLDAIERHADITRAVIAARATLESPSPSSHTWLWSNPW